MTEISCFSMVILSWWLRSRGLASTAVSSTLRYSHYKFEELVITRSRENLDLECLDVLELLNVWKILEQLTRKWKLPRVAYIGIADIPLHRGRMNIIQEF